MLRVSVPINTSDATDVIIVHVQRYEGGTGRRIRRTAVSCVLAVGDEVLKNLAFLGREVEAVDKHLVCRLSDSVSEASRFTRDTNCVAFQAGGVEACVSR